MSWKGIEGRAFSPHGFDQHVGRIALLHWKPEFVVLHNTGVPKLSEWHKTSGATRMKNLEHYYRDTMKWSGGPHLFVADDYIWAFTHLNVPGTHSPSWNRVAWGVEMVGDYDSEALNSHVRANTIRALAALHLKAGLDPGTLRLHKEDPQTTHKHCPGKHVSKGDIVHAVRHYLDCTKVIREASRPSIPGPGN
jgi:N-acetylmuramoyl-L-alanine amidase